MIVLSVGLPGRFAEWCESLLFEIAAAAIPNPLIFNANSFEEIGRELVANDCTSAVVVIRQPSVSMAQTLNESGKRFLLLLEDPSACAAALSEDHGIEPIDAIRTASDCSVRVRPLIASQHARVLRATSDLNARDIAKAICEHFQFSLSDEQIDSAINAEGVRLFEQRRKLAIELVIPSKSQPDNDTSHDLGLHLKEHTAPDVAGEALGPLWRNLNGGELREVIWSRELFFHGDDPRSQLPIVLDATGVARCLAFGPLMRLPSGAWSCGLLMACSNSAVGLTLCVEVIADVMLNRVVFELTEPGLFEVEFSFVLGNTDNRVDLRLYLTNAAFEGQLAILRARMSSLPARRNPGRAA